MTDADVIEILSSEGVDEEAGDSDEGGASMSQDDSDDYGYSDSDDASDGLADGPRPGSTSEKKPPYRLIDGDMLKQVQVCRVWCGVAAWVAGTTNCGAAVYGSVLVARKEMVYAGSAAALSQLLPVLTHLFFVCAAIVRVLAPNAHQHSRRDCRARRCPRWPASGTASAPWPRRC